MKLSIITVTWNNLQGLRFTCESVISQSYTGYEWIIVDGGSTDGTCEYLQSLSPKPTHWCSEPDQGIYNAMNKGISWSHGDYLLFLNSGDTLADASVLQRVVTELHDADIIYGDALFCKPHKKRLVQYPETFTLYHLWRGFTPCHQATFIRAALLKENGYDERYRIVADYRKWLEWKLAGCRYQHINVVVCNYMLNGISTTNQSLHRQEHDAVIAELYSPQLREQMEYVEWLRHGKGHDKQCHEGRTKSVTPFCRVLWRKLQSHLFGVSKHPSS